MQPKTRPMILLVCALIIFSSAVCQAKTVYVKTTGLDTNDGLSWDTAKKTVGAGVTTAISGDEIWVAAGTYQAWSIPRIACEMSLYGGFAGSETSRSQRDWAQNKTILDGGSGDVFAIGPSYDFNSDNLQNVNVDGFVFQNCDTAIACSGSSPVIAHCKIQSTGRTITISSQSPIITSNIFTGPGIGISPTWDATPKIVNNTFVGCAQGICYTTGSLTISNNIFAFGRYGIYKWDPNSVGNGVCALSRNVFYANSGSNYVDTPQGATDMFCDPLFVDRLGGDYHMIPDSPCVNTGDDSAPNLGDLDIDGQPRIFAQMVDIGADEVVAAQTASPAFAPTANGVVFPVDVTIKSATDGALIRYTTNGLDPGASDAVVSGLITVSGPGTIKAKAWKTGMIPSAIASAIYTDAENLAASIKTKALNQAASTDHAVISHLVHKDYFYIESDDRSSGIQVFKINHGMQAGMRVKVTGTLMLSGVEKYIKATSVVQNGAGTILPLVVSNRDIGGGDWKYNSSTKAGQVGVKEYRQVKTGETWTPTLLPAVGMNNIGLLVATTGRVTYVGTGFFYIDDGSGLMDADNLSAGYKGLRINGTVPVDAGVDPIGKLVRVTGSVSLFNRSGNGYRQVYARDVEILQ